MLQHLKSWSFTEKLHVGDRSLILEDALGDVVTVPIESVVLLGEYTNQNGPFTEDHYCILLTSDGGTYYMPADRISEEELTRLGDCLGDQLSFELAGQTDFFSRGIWPAAIKGVPFLEFHSKWRTVTLTFRESIIRELQARASERT